MSEFNTTIDNTFSSNTNAIISQSISISQTKRTFSTVEFTCSALHYIVGEMSDDLDFTVYREKGDGTQSVLFFSQLNPQNRVISSNGSIEKRKFSENNFKFIIEDIGTEENSFLITFKISSSNSKYNYYPFSRKISYSTFISEPEMTGSLEIKNITSNIIPFFTKSLNLEWTAAEGYVNSNPSNGYILSYSVDGGSSWFDVILSNVYPINKKCTYSFNIEGFPNDSSLVFKICCFNDLNIKSNEIRSKNIYKCDIKPVSDIKVNIFNDTDELESLENSAKLITISYYPSTCSTKDGYVYPNLNFWYSIIFPSDFVIYQGNEPINIYSFSSANILSLNINIVDSLSDVESTQLYILRDKLNEFLGKELIKNVNFIIQTKLINAENTEDSIIVDSHSSFLINLLGYEIIAPTDLTINNNSLSTVYKIINNNSYLIPDGEGYIYLKWKNAINTHNENEQFLYDIYIGIDGVYTYENTTINNYYHYKMKKVDKKCVLSYYLIARNKYASVKSETIPRQEVHFYDRPCLNNFILNRTKNACNVLFSLDIESSIEDLVLTNVSVNVNNGIDGSISGLPTSNNILRKQEVRCNVSNLLSTSAYILTLSYTDNSGITDLITEEFSIPSASPIMEITPECITMGGADINNDYILNIKGNANIDGNINIKPYEINALVDDINTFKQSGNYVCDFINASQIVHMLPLTEPGSFSLVVVGGFVPIQFLIYTQYKGDNYIYMRNFFENVWSEWVLLHQKMD